MTTIVQGVFYENVNNCTFAVLAPLLLQHFIATKEITTQVLEHLSTASEEL